MTDDMREASIRYESNQEPLDDEERELMNPDTWDWENPVEVVISSNLVFSYPIEFTRDEHRIVAKAADDAGMTVHAFIKQLVLAAARER